MVLPRFFCLYVRQEYLQRVLSHGLNLLRCRQSHPILDKMPKNKVLNRVHSIENWVLKNAVLNEMGSNYRLFITNQSPKFQIRATHCPFPDGKFRKSSGIRADQAGAAEKAFKLCILLDDDPKALEVQQKEQQKPGYTGWRALSLELEQHLRNELEIQDSHPDYWRHSRELGFLSGDVEPALIQKWVESSDKHSRERTRRVVTCNRLIEIGVELDQQWLYKIKSGNKYSPSKAIEPRDLPSDAQVEAFVDSISNPRWKKVFAYIATWGLRNHEPFRLHNLPDDLGYLAIADNSKTGFREIIPAHPEWIDRWELNDIELPSHDSTWCNMDLGRKVTKYMARHRHLAPWRAMPKTYDLRHAWAARLHTHERYNKVDVELAAEMMGHSERVHRADYLRWTKKEDIKRRLRQKMEA